MTVARERETRPLPGTRTSENQPGGRLALIVAEAPSRVTAGSGAESFFVNCHAVLVRSVKRTHRHLFFNLPAAERAVLRALARGDRAEMILVQLVPVQHLDLVRGDDDD